MLINLTESFLMLRSLTPENKNISSTTYSVLNTYYTTLHGTIPHMIDILHTKDIDIHYEIKDIIENIRKQIKNKIIEFYKDKKQSLKQIVIKEQIQLFKQEYNKNIKIRNIDDIIIIIENITILKKELIK